MTDPISEFEADTPAPRWVKLSVAVGVILAILVVIMLLTGHGPGHHFGGAAMPADMSMPGGTPVPGSSPSAPASTSAASAPTSP